MTYLEVKLDVLANTVKEMMQEISRKDELVVQRTHIPLVPETTKVNIPKKFATQPWYQGLKNDSFMYSIHDTIEDEVQNKKMEEDSPDMICMFNGISSMEDSPNLDWYDDKYDHDAESLGVNGQTLPLCFSSFKFLKEIFEQVVNIEEGKPFDEIVKDVSVGKKDISDLGLQSPSLSNLQSSGKNSELETEFETLKCNPLPLEVNSLQILKGEGA
jgi:hypothetical protein